LDRVAAERLIARPHREQQVELLIEARSINETVGVGDYQAQPLFDFILDGQMNREDLAP
jgi:hypothetical protein